LSERARAGGQARRVAAVERCIRELVASAPPLTDEQRDRLAAILRPAPNTPDGAA
jgi:hypothetical protein